MNKFTVSRLVTLAVIVIGAVMIFKQLPYGALVLIVGLLAFLLD